MASRPTRLVALFAALGISGCFLGFDSRWGEARRAQSAAAAHATPTEIAPGAQPAPAPAARTFRVRFRPSEHYLAQTIDVPKQVQELVEDANRVLVGQIGLRLEIAGIRPWSSQDDESLDRSIQALQAEDDGKDVDLVVGMIGALSQLSDSFHQVGIANLLGSYVVVRGAGRLAEEQSIDRAFDQLSDEERAKLIKVRKRHRALAVFLHEVGHALGAVHETDRTSLMNPVYDTVRNRFGGSATALMRVSVDETDRGEVARAQLAILEDPSFGLALPEERREEIVRLRRLLGPRAVRAPSAPAAPSSTAALDGLSRPASVLPGDARERYERAAGLLHAGYAGLAFETARPLFASYPDDLGVQDLRCQLATLRFLETKELVEECAQYSRLTGDAGTRISAK